LMRSFDRPIAANTWLAKLRLEVQAAPSETAQLADRSSFAPPRRFDDEVYYLVCYA
jgi:hypothetical protein